MARHNRKRRNEVEDRNDFYLAFYSAWHALVKFFHYD